MLLVPSPWMSKLGDKVSLEADAIGCPSKEPLRCSRNDLVSLRFHFMLSTSSWECQFRCIYGVCNPARLGRMTWGLNEPVLDIILPDLILEWATEIWTVAETSCRLSCCLLQRLNLHISGLDIWTQSNSYLLILKLKLSHLTSIIELIENEEESFHNFEARTLILQRSKKRKCLINWLSISSLSKESVPGGVMRGFRGSRGALSHLLNLREIQGRRPLPTVRGGLIFHPALTKINSCGVGNMLASCLELFTFKHPKEDYLWCPCPRSFTGWSQENRLWEQAAAFLVPLPLLCLCYKGCQGKGEWDNYASWTKLAFSTSGIAVALQSDTCQVSAV